MGSTTSRILVPFHGEGAGAGPLTWAQLGIWQTMARTGMSMNIGGTFPIEAGTPVEAMTRLLRYVVSRHQALRTRLRFGPDGPPDLVVSESGEVPLEIVDVGPDDDPEAAVARLHRQYESVPFDYPVEWPIRMGVVRRAGALTHGVLVYCHVAVDGFGIDAIVRDLANLDQATGEATAPVAGLTPLEIAAKQRTPAGHMQSEKSLRYWEHLVQAIPAQRFGISDDPREPRFWEITLRSRAMHLAMESIAGRTGIGVGYVVLAAYAVALARRTGRSPSVAQLVVSNRFRPRCADSVSQLAQLSLCVIDVADTTFDQVVRLASAAGTRAYMHGYFDPLAHNDMLARIAGERGEVDIAIIVNDRRTRNGPPPLGEPPTPDQVEAALPLTTARWSRTIDVLDATLNISVDAAPDAVDLAVCMDTHRMGPAEIEALAREMERVCVEAAFDPAAPTAVAQPSTARR